MSKYCVEVPLGEEVPDAAIFKFQRVGPMMIHNYLCACCRERKAVIETWSGILQPCWECQHRWKVVELNWLDKVLDWLGCR